ncbi:DUF401 family protein [Candidatus Lokiarchaeum ossiferum]|uniref:DUF401 family protein n=1 Tax=Candidatus Lokiarchaeum ossiferum TaxID=2951803 RepID=UPI00352DCF96
MLIPSWISFLLVITFLMIFSKKELVFTLTIGSIAFGLLSEVNIWISFASIITNLNVLILAASVGLLPILGAIMEESGLMVELIQKMDISKKNAMMISPAIFGLLPVAGGALMSAPLIEQIDTDSSDISRKIAINVWYRHLLILIYPLSTTLIVCTEIAGLKLYNTLAYLVIPFIIMFLIGYIFLIRNTLENSERHSRDLKVVVHHILPILIAPIFDFLGRSILTLIEPKGITFAYPEIFLFVGLCFSVLLALKFANLAPNRLNSAIKRMKVWRFPLLIIVIYFFLDIFTNSGVPEVIGSLNMNFTIFLLLGFFFGFSTGRVQLSLSFLIPIYLFQYAVLAMSYFNFTLIYLTTFLGYLMSPIHPCLAYTINYFKADYKQTFWRIATPTFVNLLIVLVVYQVVNFF